MAESLDISIFFQIGKNRLIYIGSIIFKVGYTVCKDILNFFLRAFRIGFYHRAGGNVAFSFVESVLLSGFREKRGSYIFSKIAGFNFLPCAISLPQQGQEHLPAIVIRLLRWEPILVNMPIVERGLWFGLICFKLITVESPSIFPTFGFFIFVLNIVSPSDMQLSCCAVPLHRLHRRRVSIFPSRIRPLSRYVYNMGFPHQCFLNCSHLPV